jgi:hypothetical protein
MGSKEPTQSINNVADYGSCTTLHRKGEGLSIASIIAAILNLGSQLVLT